MLHVDCGAPPGKAKLTPRRVAKTNVLWTSDLILINPIKIVTGRLLELTDLKVVRGPSIGASDVLYCHRQTNTHTRFFDILHDVGHT